ncbi:MAG TPA: hypothetical protein VMV54_07550 [Acidocella sp.]|nr:hypothetical protein [Acidocella sp.]
MAAEQRVNWPLADRSLAWREVFADAWFFPTMFFAVFGGGPAIVTLIQTVTITHDFASPIREIMDAYRYGMAQFGGWTEPLLGR